jgi:hydroxymethylbilane synthase
MKKTIRIGTRDSQLAVWQATLVQDELNANGVVTELVYIKSDGDIDLVTPLYEMGVQGVFTKTLDAALLSDHIDIAVHSMKDVPTQLAKGLAQAAVLPRASYKDLLVYKGDGKKIAEELGFVNGEWTAMNAFSGHHARFIVASSSVRRKAQWLNRYPHHQTDNLRGNVNTRLQKLQDNNWNGAIFAAAGLERIGLRPANAIDLDWMLPAPTQGSIMIACREKDKEALEICAPLTDIANELCAQIEKDFLRVLMGGCATPISALAQLKNNTVFFQGNILSLDGREKIEVALETAIDGSKGMGTKAAQMLLEKGGRAIITSIRNAGA